MGGTTTISAQPGAAVMVVEVGYNYQPINVRQRTDQSLKNAGRITPRSCNTFAA